MSSTDLITGALGAVLAPDDLAGQTELQAAILTGSLRDTVATALQAGWPTEAVEVVWSDNLRFSRARAYVTDFNGSRLAGTLTIGGYSDRINAILGTENGGSASMRLNHDVLKSVLA